MNPAPCAFAQSRCGGLALAVAGVDVVLRHTGALWIERDRVLVVADLHLEKGSAYAARGQMLPPYDTRETLRRLMLEVAALAPARLVLLGDTFHDGRGEARLAGDDVEALRSLAAATDLVWIVGNHDEAGPAFLPGKVLADLAVQALRLTHEPAGGPAPGEVAGHLHPCAKVRGRGAAVRRRCFITDGERLILPAFGAYAGGLNVLDAAYQGLFVRPPLAVALGATRAHAVGWPSLRPD